jgi:hypothetical protein
VDGKFRFPGAQTPHRFSDRIADVIHGEIAKQVEAARIGMSRQFFIIVLACQHFQRGVFQRMIASGCQIRWEIQDWIKYLVHFTVKNEDSHPKVTVFV